MIYLRIGIIFLNWNSFEESRKQLYRPSLTITILSVEFWISFDQILFILFDHLMIWHIWHYFFGFIFIHSLIPLLSQKGRALFGPIRFWDKASFHFTCGQMPVDWAEPERLSCSAHSTQISISQVLNLSLSR